MNSKVLETKPFRIWTQHDIIFAEVFGENISLTDAVEMVEARHTITGGRNYPLLVDVSSIKSVSKEARDYCAEGKAIEGLSAVSLYTNSIIAKIVANFFLNFNKPKIPISLLTSWDEAKKWLEKHKDK